MIFPRIHLSTTLALAAALFAAGPLFSQEADFLVPEEFSAPETLRLRPGFDRQAEAAARYLQALFIEETEGPDSALEAKRKALGLDPAFTDLAMDVAHQYLRRGDTSEAITVLKDASKFSLHRADPLVALAGIYLRQLQKPDLAEKFALRALAVAPDNPAPYQMLFEIYRATLQNQKAENLFAKALKRDPTSASFWLELADLRLRDAIRLGRETTKVLELLDRAQRDSRDDAGSLVKTGDGFMLCGRIDRAIPLYQLALRLQPGTQGLMEKLAACLLQAGRAEEATGLLEEMVARNPLDFRLYDQLADIFLKAGQTSKALAHSKQALLVAPPDPRRYAEIAQLCLRVGDPQSAVAFMDEAEGHFPKLAELAFLKAVALGQAKRHEEAIKIFEKILVESANTNPDIINADFYFSYGVSAEQAGRFATAAEALKKSIELDPVHAARACNYLGYMWADRGENLDEAELLIRKALASEPGNGAYLDSLGWVLFKKGLYSQALGELLRAAELLKEEDPVVFEHIGDACEKLGKSAEAVLSWQKALRLDPGNGSITSKLDAQSSHVAQKPGTSPNVASP